MLVKGTVPVIPPYDQKMSWIQISLSLEHWATVINLSQGVEGSCHEQAFLRSTVRLHTLEKERRIIRNWYREILKIKHWAILSIALLVLGMYLCMRIWVCTCMCILWFHNGSWPFFVTVTSKCRIWKPRYILWRKTAQISWVDSSFPKPMDILTNEKSRFC